MVELLVDAAVHFVLLFELRLHVLEALLDLALDLVVGRTFQVEGLEELAVLVPNEVQHFALSERGHLVAVLSVAVEEAVYLDVAVQQDEEVVLVSLCLAALSAHELYVLVEEESLVLLPPEVAIDRLLFQKRFIDEEQKFLLHHS